MPSNVGYLPTSRPICGKLGAREGAVQSRPDSRIAVSFGSRLEGIARHLSSEHLTLGLILLVAGFLAFSLSSWLGWFIVGAGVIMTWHARMQGTHRGLLYFLTLLGSTR